MVSETKRSLEIYKQSRGAFHFGICCMYLGNMGPVPYLAPSLFSKPNSALPNSILRLIHCCSSYSGEDEWAGEPTAPITSFDLVCLLCVWGERGCLPARAYFFILFACPSN